MGLWTEVVDGKKVFLRQYKMSSETSCLERQDPGSGEVVRTVGEDVPRGEGVTTLTEGGGVTEGRDRGVRPVTRSKEDGN